MGYKEYVEKAIVESGLDESCELLEILESAETVEDVEAVEEYLTEKKCETADPDPRGKVSAKQALYNLKIANAGAKDRFAQKSAWKGAMKGKDFGEGYDKACKMYDSGQIAAGATALLAAVGAASLAIRSAVKKSNAAPAKQIEKQIKDLEGQAQDVAKRCKKGEVTAKEAKVLTKKIQTQIEKLQKDAENLASSEAKVTKESVMVDVYESEKAGDITTEEAEILLSLLQ